MKNCLLKYLQSCLMKMLILCKIIMDANLGDTRGHSGPKCKHHYLFYKGHVTSHAGNANANLEFIWSLQFILLTDAKWFMLFSSLVLIGLVWYVWYRTRFTPLWPCHLKKKQQNSEKERLQYSVNNLF